MFPIAVISPYVSNNEFDREEETEMTFKYDDHKYFVHPEDCPVTHRRRAEMVTLKDGRVAIGDIVVVLEHDDNETIVNTAAGVMSLSTSDLDRAIRSTWLDGLFHTSGRSDLACAENTNA